MHDTFLYNKLAAECAAICKKEHIQKLTLFQIAVHSRSHVNQEHLKNFLLEEVPDFVDIETIVIVDKNQEIEELQAIIIKIEGLINETPDY